MACYTSLTIRPLRGRVWGGISIQVDVIDGSVRVENLGPNEPSTIFTALPVTEPTDPDSVPRPGYYPSYADLTPEQRWIYLRWLEDISQPVNIGYVFIYYYGLERQMLTGDFEAAFDEILALRAAHGGQPSFDLYSRSGLLNAAVARKDERRIAFLYAAAPPDHFRDTDLMIAYRAQRDFGTEGLLRLVSSLPGVNKRYVKAEPDHFRQSLAEVLSERFGAPYLPFAKKYAVAELPLAQQMLFANISFPDEVRNPRLPSFSSHQPFVNEVRDIFAAAHERCKELLAKRRKLEKTKKLPPAAR